KELSCSVGELFVPGSLVIAVLLQVQVKDVLIQPGLHKHTGRYCPGGASSAKSSEPALLWLRDMKIRTAMEEDELLAGPQLHLDISWQLMQVV
ncbi:hypothetical protein PIB30_018629, partial [Stylosanthes scabra]|nr:hypothetical protein [Stylosanthes scabra]